MVQTSPASRITRTVISASRLVFRRHDRPQCPVCGNDTQLRSDWHDDLELGALMADRQRDWVCRDCDCGCAVREFADR